MKPFREVEKFTRIHNYLFDVVMPAIKPNAWKVLCCILRHTAGWVTEDGQRKLTDRISYSQLMKKTGIKGRGTLKDAIDELLQKELITLNPGDSHESNEYGLNWDYEAPSTEIVLPNEAPSTEIVPQGSTEIVLGVVRKSYTQKKVLKKDSKEKDSRDANDAPAQPALLPDLPPAPKSKRQSLHQPVIDAYVRELGYTPQNMGREAKAAKWLATNAYTPEQVIACYRHMKADKFWKDKPLSLQKVADAIPEFNRAAAPAAVRASFTATGARHDR